MLHSTVGLLGEKKDRKETQGMLQIEKVFFPRLFQSIASKTMRILPIYNSCEEGIQEC